MTKNCQRNESLLFAQKDVYPKLLRLYIKIGRLSAPISYAPKLYASLKTNNEEKYLNEHWKR